MHEGLLAAIIAEPARDDLRLVLADWLRENGQQERGDFIAVQIELAALPVWHHLRLSHPGDAIEPRSHRGIAEYNNPMTAARRAYYVAPVHTADGHTRNWSDGLLEGDSFSLSFQTGEGARMDALGLRLLSFRHDRLRGITYFTCDSTGQPDPHAKKRDGLKRHEIELFRAAGPGQEEWFGPAHHELRAGSDVGDYLGWFTRGLLSKLTLTSEAWLAHADRITAGLPVEDVELTTDPPWDVRWGANERPACWLVGEPEQHLFAERELQAAGPVAVPGVPRRLLELRWPKIRFRLPQPVYGPSVLGSLWPAFREMSSWRGSVIARRFDIPDDL